MITYADAVGCETLRHLKRMRRERHIEYSAAAAAEKMCVWREVGIIMRGLGVNVKLGYSSALNQ